LRSALRLSRSRSILRAVRRRGGAAAPEIAPRDLPVAVSYGGALARAAPRFCLRLIIERVLAGVLASGPITRADTYNRADNCRRLRRRWLGGAILANGDRYIAATPDVINSTPGTASRFQFRRRCRRRITDTQSVASRDGESYDCTDRVLSLSLFLSLFPDFAEQFVDYTPLQLSSYARRAPRVASGILGRVSRG